MANSVYSQFLKRIAKHDHRKVLLTPPNEANSCAGLGSINLAHKLPVAYHFHGWTPSA